MSAPHLSAGDVWAVAQSAVDDPPPTWLAHLQAHAASCPECAARVARARAADAKIAGLLDAADVAPPDFDVEAVVQRAGVRQIEHGRRGPRGGWLLTPARRVVAASALLCVAGAVAAALPASPVHRLLMRLLDRTPAARVQPSARVRGAHAGSARLHQTVPSGVAIVPDSQVEIAFASAQRRGSILVVLGAGGLASVTPVGGRPHGFAVGTNRIAVANHGDTASYDVRIPQGLARARITIGGSVVFARGPATVSRADTTGAQFLIPLARAPQPRP